MKGKLGKSLKSWNASSPQITHMSQVSCHREKKVRVEIQSPLVTSVPWYMSGCTGVDTQPCSPTSISWFASEKKGGTTVVLPRPEKERSFSTPTRNRSSLEIQSPLKRSALQPPWCALSQVAISWTQRGQPARLSVSCASLSSKPARQMRWSRSTPSPTR